MDETPKKGAHPLTIDRAAFLLLRVKKAFKKKRQQRKEKLAATQQLAAQLGGFSGSQKSKQPPPLLRSRTLPAIIVPGISILQNQLDSNRFKKDGINLSSCSFSARLSIASRTTPRVSLTCDDSPLDYRRKSSEFPPTGVTLTPRNSTSSADPYIYAFDDCERHPDGTVILRIPAPHVVAARAYRMSTGNAAMSPTGTGTNLFSPPFLSSNQNTNSSSSGGGGGGVGGGGGGGGSGGGGNTTLYRLARLLNQSTKPSSNSPQPKDDTPRRLSWERRDPANSKLPRSASIDSMVEAVWNDTPRPSLTVTEDNSNVTNLNVQTTDQHRSSQQLHVNYGSLLGPTIRRESLLSPSPGRRTKQHRGMNEITLPDLITKSSSTAAAIASPPKSAKTSSPTYDKFSPLFRKTFTNRNSASNLEYLLLQQQKLEKATSSSPSSSAVGLLRKQNSVIVGTSKSNVITSLTTSSSITLSGSGKGGQQQSYTKMTKKQLKLAQAQFEKLNQINIHLHALFSAVEHGHLEKARTILESTDVDVNSLNTDGLAPLDVAVLSNNRSMTKMLLQHGAIEGTHFKGSDNLGSHLTNLLRDAENKIQELGSCDESPQTPFSTRASFSSIIGNTGQSVTGCAGSENDKQLGLWERRVKGLRRMLLGWDQARPPDPPQLVLIDVTGTSSVTVRIHEPFEGSLATKFKVQWSTRVDFSNIVGEREMSDWTSLQGVMGTVCRVGDLTQGRRYFFRATCGNVKGWGKYCQSVPTSVTPSSWRDVENRDHRFSGRQRILDELFAAVRLARPDDASDIPLETPAIQRRNPKKKTTIKQLFSAASKFQKNLRRGIYFACILYNEDKVLVTNEDFVPVIEIDETYPSYLHTDYHWLMKVACTWDDVKSLRTDMERNATSAVHFRTKLLSAASQMQSTLCITDLGQLFHRPLRDSHGTVVLSCVNSVKSQKSVSVLNSRWIPLNKIQKKISALHEDNNINEILMYSIAEQISYHQASTFKLSRGLYLGYLKMQSSVDLIQIVVPSKTPNVLPHCKIRDNPHVSSEEWEFLKKKPPSSLEFRPQNIGPTEVQQIFLESLTSTAHRLFKYMDIPIEEAINHRLYDIEVIELNPDVSFLIICPPAELSCAVPGQREILLQRGDLLSLSVQAFEMIHLRTYQNSIIQKYSRLSCILELDTVLANHSHREAFSSTEVQLAKERLAKLQELTSNLNAVWKGVRWLMDVIGFARDRTCVPGIDMKNILDYKSKMAVEEEAEIINGKRQLLQPPSRDNKLVKASPGRGSWPGPAVNLSGSNGILCAEHSKSDQHLSLGGNLTSRFLSATSGFENSSSRKNSADSNYSNSGHSFYSASDNCGDHILPRLPPSRSEDTLNSAKKISNHHHQSHRKRSTTMNASLSAASSPLLNIRSSSAFAAATESVHSLSSDSESASCPISTITPNKHPHRLKQSTLAESKSMSNVQTAGTKNFDKKLERVEVSNTLHIHESESDEKRQACRPGLMGGASATTEASTSASNSSSIIQVYAAYETGLAFGTSLKLRVYTTTTAREVIDLVVKQLNMAVVLKGKEGPIYTSDKLDDFCLVAVIGARERCLRDDFRPLQLQNPWIKGRLYVRQKHDLLAAIEHSNRDAQLI